MESSDLPPSDPFEPLSAQTLASSIVVCSSMNHDGVYCSGEREDRQSRLSAVVDLMMNTWHRSVTTRNTTRVPGVLLQYSWFDLRRLSMRVVIRMNKRDLGIVPPERDSTTEIQPRVVLERLQHPNLSFRAMMQVNRQMGIIMDCPQGMAVEDFLLHFHRDQADCLRDQHHRLEACQMAASADPAA